MTWFYSPGMGSGVSTRGVRMATWLGAVLLAVWVAPGRSSPPVQRAYSRPGDVTLGGLFPLHFIECEKVPSMWSLQLVEAMAFAVEEVNNRSDLLPGVRLGFEIRDTCYAEDTAVWSALSLVRADTTPDAPGAGQPDAPVSGIVGPVSSTVSIVVAAVADLFRVPVISVSATSDELSDKERFPYFLRTVPPDRLQSEAMVDVIERMGWEYVSIIYRADTYGIRGAHALEGLAESRGICVALSIPVQRLPSSAELGGIAALLQGAHKARVVVVFSAQDTADLIVAAVERSVGTGRFIWFGSDAWTHGIKPPESVPPAGSLFLGLHNPVPPGFRQFLAGMGREEAERNPWFREFLSDHESAHNCTVWEDEACGMPHLDQFSTASFMSPSVDAVYAFAHALHSLVNGSDRRAVSLAGPELLDRLRNVSFEGTRGRLQFTPDGDMEGKYTLSNALAEDGNFRLVQVGLWDALDPSQRLRLDEDIVWPSGSTEVPASTCVDVCQPGYRLAPLEEKCCYGCFQCEDYAIVVHGKECVECEETHWPDEDRLSCNPIIPSVTDWTDTMHLTSLILSCMGLALSVSIAIGLTVYRNHTVIKASSRELSSVNVLGLILAFVSVFLLSAQPTPALCCLSKAMVSLCFTLTYAPTLLKVSRIYRIFRASKKSAGRPKMISPGIQLVMSFSLILIQVVCIVVTTIVSDCTPRSLVRIPRTNHLELYCELSTGFLVSSVYNLVLILACCLFAFLARKVPDNYNESKFIGVSVYSTLLACLAAIPVYVTARDVSQKVAAVCLAVLLNAYLTALCVYLPKLYAIKFLPAEADRWAGTRGQGTAAGSSLNNRVQPSTAARIEQTS